MADDNKLAEAAQKYFYFTEKWNREHLTGGLNKEGWTMPKTYGMYSENERRCQHNFDVITGLAKQLSPNGEFDMKVYNALDNAIENAEIIPYEQLEQTYAKYSNLELLE